MQPANRAVEDEAAEPMTEPTNVTGQDGADPSMEEILASIRRILNEDEAPRQPVPPLAPSASEPALLAVEADEDVLVLNRTMLVSAPEDEPPIQPLSRMEESDPVATDEGAVEAAEVAPGETPPASIEPDNEPVAAAEPMPQFDPTPVVPAMALVGAPPTTPAIGLLAPEAAAAAASSVDGLLRMLAASRSTQTHRGGPTIEDLVREEIRPLLKEWLDSHLPALVERQVRSEIERVVGRAVS
jgi:cell pole-organizing protein PopZ